ncbi:hypothetical protein AN963_13985 [Brevibacillus choshinensis]|uniref:Uncharacterized protein n=1 Tax=Brevibacillus choshinensis TaxID=54911 RepID=A0ABR5N674_BRECH|nr:hypothetical protein AN963_13985 [Brevibacillus choshinensis]
MLDVSQKLRDRDNQAFVLRRHSPGWNFSQKNYLESPQNKASGRAKAGRGKKGKKRRSLEPDRDDPKWVFL